MKTRGRVHHVHCVASSVHGLADVGHMDSLSEATREQVRSLLSEAQLAVQSAEPDPALEGVTLPLQEDAPTEDAVAFWTTVAWPSPKHKVATLESIPVTVRPDVSTLLREFVGALMQAHATKDDAELIIRC